MKFRFPPYEHQQKILDETTYTDFFGVLWDPGTGKSKLMIDNVAVLYRENKVDTLLILAPNGVHTNWIVEELPKHLPLEIIEEVETLEYASSKANSKKFQRQFKYFLQHDGLIILAMSYEASITKNGRETLAKILKRKSVFLVADESHRIKTPGAKRTRAILAKAKRAKYKRILTGTPVTNSPFDVYTQFRLLNPDFWKDEGFADYDSFKTYFGVWKTGYGQGREYQVCESFRHLDELHRMISPHSSRLLKEDVLDLPPKVYCIHRFDLSKNQQTMYNQIRDEYYMILEDNLITAELAIVRLIRLQQILSGYIPTGDSDKPLYDIEEKNSRLAALANLLKDIPHKAIIFCRFKRDTELIVEMLGEEAVLHNGDVSIPDRLIARQGFQKGKIKYFVSTLDTGSEGFTLTAAKTVIYYSNNFKLKDRLQSEDRAHRAGQIHSVQYIDLIARNTVDEKIRESLMKKYDIATQVTKDNFKRWTKIKEI